jgi:hypothetical protein
VSVLILSKTCDLVHNTSAIIEHAKQLQQHTFELDCVQTSLEFYQRKTQRKYSLFLGDVLETACLDANQGIVPLASVLSQGMQLLTAPTPCFNRCHADVARKSLAASIWIPSAAGNVSIGDVTGLRLAVSTDMMNEVLWLWAVFAQQGLNIGKTTSQVRRYRPSSDYTFTRVMADLPFRSSSSKAPAKRSN